MSNTPSPPFLGGGIDQDDGMATMLLSPDGHNMPGPQNGLNKRYRPAPAKTFQCRGYGECRMVFSRSEHLARHIRYGYLSFSANQEFITDLDNS